MIASLVFILGVVFGSFFNVVIYRVPLEKSIAKGRSMCPSCGHELTAAELIPIVSIIIQGFKCKNCKQPISPRYLIVELLTGLLWLASYLIFQDQGPWMVVSACLLVSLCIIIGYIDFDTQYISDTVLLVFWLARLAVIWFVTDYSYWDMLFSMLVGAGLYSLIYFGAKAYYKREAFGMGDILYLAALGSWFSPLHTAILGYGSFFVAGAILLLAMIFKKFKFKLKEEVPFGPAMSIMAVILYFWGGM
ncbi:prepilin peptidase [Streptococcus panodentis]|uniref:Prepilin peptidase n=2 Tax=Streptococcus TaxID=1301 RepID=A0ABS5AUS5_9STRE|nr:prepilin peptidase [Streptococcus panodentis]